ncbi:MAG: glucose-1-phosphate cytidylyltransferase [Alphaproteobacteria bacterium]|nr:glucose-1-phosphate cytidylyltransferase [Alphaproteobacteria bacterium]
MKAVILAGGLGTRISEETDHLPKPMVSIGGKPILWHIMKSYAHHGIKDFIICLGYKGYVIKEYFTNYFRHHSDLTVDLKTGEMVVHNSTAEDWRVTLVETGLSTMTGGRLKAVRDYVGKETFCFTYGDGVADIDIGKLISFHKQHRKKATVIGVTPPGRFGVLDSKGGKVLGFSEKIDNKDTRVSGGFFVLEPSVFSLLKNDSTVWEKAPLETLAKQGELMSYAHDGFWMAMDTLRDKRSLEELWDSKKAPWAVWEK